MFRQDRYRLFQGVGRFTLETGVFGGKPGWHGKVVVQATNGVGQGTVRGVKTGAVFQQALADANLVHGLHYMAVGSGVEVVYTQVENR